jgi:hypothetical protein
VVGQRCGEWWVEGLPAGGAAFLAQQDEAVFGVEVGEAEGGGAAAAGGGFGVEAE